MNPTLSIVFGTLNRLRFLQRALYSIGPAVGKLSCEIIVVDGGSTDGTLEWLDAPATFPGGKRPEAVRIIQQRERTGAVAAFHVGFAAARGEYVAAFNDDAEYFGHPLQVAVELLRSDPGIGQVAIPFATQRVHAVEEIVVGQHPVPEVALVGLPTIGKVPYANFGVISKALGDRLGWWGEFYHYAGDTHLSTSVWAAGLRVAPLDVSFGHIVHYEAQDETRLPNVEAAHFSAIWHGPNSPLLPKRSAAPVLKPKQPMTMPATVPLKNPITRPQMQRAAAQRTREILARQQAMTPRVLMRYLGNKHGNLTYQRPGSRQQYVFGAAHREQWVEASDVTWLLGLRSHSKRLFERAEEQHG